MIAPDVAVSGLTVRGLQIGLHTTAPRFVAEAVEALDNAEGMRLGADASAGWSAAGARLRDCRFENNGTGMVLNGVSGVTLERGRLAGNDEAGLQIAPGSEDVILHDVDFAQNRCDVLGANGICRRL